MTIHKRIPAEDYELLKREYRSKEELQTMIVEAILKEQEEFREQGKAEGVQIGKAEGKRERDRQIAHAMTHENYPLAVIARLLNLSETEVQTLLNQPTDE